MKAVRSRLKAVRYRLCRLYSQAPPAPGKVSLTRDSADSAEFSAVIHGKPRPPLPEFRQLTEFRRRRAAARRKSTVKNTQARRRRGTAFAVLALMRQRAEGGVMIRIVFAALGFLVACLRTRNRRPERAVPARAPSRH